MRYRLFMFALLLLAPLFFSCENIITALSGRGCSVDDRARFTAVFPKGDVGETYAAVIISDVHFGEEGSDKEDFLAYIEPRAKSAPASQPFKFCFVLGDIADHAHHNEYVQYVAFRTKLEAMGMEVFSVPGNHDTYPEGDYGRNYLSDVYPTTFFRLGVGDHAYYFLDTADGTLGHNQLATLERLLKADSAKKVILTHYPTYPNSLHWIMLNSAESSKLLSLYTKHGVVLTFSGHTHAHSELEHGTFKDVNVGSIWKEYEYRNFVILYVDGKTYRIESVDF